MDPLADQRRLIDGLERTLKTAAGSVRRFETHISWVLVAGEYAYKIKKAVRLPYLNFSTLDARRYYCREEVRLYRRLAPDLYLDIVALSGSPERPEIGGAGEAIEYAVRMRAFGQEALWSFRVEHDLLGPRDADGLALELARFHTAAAPAPPDTAWGTPDTVAATFAATLDELAALAGDAGTRECVAALRTWETQERARRAAVFGQRRAEGRVRECHGDLHSANVLTLDGRVQVFDCLEFREGQRWIDVMDDLAFIHMDLVRHGRPDLAATLLSGYLEATGDYGGLAVLPYYSVHRALVRAKVMLLRSGQAQPSAGDEDACERDAAAYLDAAVRCARPGRAAVMITHGYSGSGKSTFARALVPVLGAVQVRSDVERKRLHGLPVTARPSAQGGEALYGEAATLRTYARLCELASVVVAAGWPVVVDAAFLTQAQRASFRALAASLDVPFFVFDIRAGSQTMVERLHARQEAGGDASDAGVEVLERQMRAAEALGAMERAIVVDTEAGLGQVRLRDLCATVLAALDKS